MATDSSPPSSSSDEKPKNSATQVPQPANEIQQAKEEVTKQSPPSVFVNSEPIREDQVQNAVKFLSHPKVRGSPVMYRRSFLERKGLTKEEIDEAFHRVPDPPPSTQATATNQEAQSKSTSNIQPAPQTQALQPAAASQTGVVSSAGTSMRNRFHWYHALYAVGILAASGAGTAVLFKNCIVPRLKSWIRKVVYEEEDPVGTSNAKPSLAEEAAAAAKAAAAAAADVATVGQEMLNSKNEEKRCFEEFMNLLDMQVQEMKSMSTAIRKLEGRTNNVGRTSLVNQEDYTPSVANHSKQTYVNGKVESDSRSVRSSSLPTSTEPSVAPHQVLYGDNGNGPKRRETSKRQGKDINDQPPNPNQQISNSRIEPRTKPWEAGQFQKSSNQVLQSQVNGEGLNSKVQDNGVTYQYDGESTVPWWQRKNARITEIEDEDELKAGPNGTQSKGQPVRRAWVPPQPPPVAMPEAAEAIRRPKQFQKEQLEEEQSTPQPTDSTDELQKVTKIAESGGVMEINGGESELNSSEIKEEQEISYEGN